MVYFKNNLSTEIITIYPHILSHSCQNARSAIEITKLFFGEENIESTYMAMATSAIANP